METMVAWMVPNITPIDDYSDGWKNGTNSMQEKIYHKGQIELISMPTMLLTDWLQLTANTTG